MSCLNLDRTRDSSFHGGIVLLRKDFFQQTLSVIKHLEGGAQAAQPAGSGNVKEQKKKHVSLSAGCFSQHRAGPEHTAAARQHLGASACPSDGLGAAGRARARGCWMDFFSLSRFHPALPTRLLMPALPPALSVALLQERSSSCLAIGLPYWETHRERLSNPKTAACPFWEGDRAPPVPPQPSSKAGSSPRVPCVG